MCANFNEHAEQTRNAWLAYFLAGFFLCFYFLFCTHKVKALWKFGRSWKRVKFWKSFIVLQDFFFHNFMNELLMLTAGFGWPIFLLWEFCFVYDFNTFNFKRYWVWCLSGHCPIGRFAFKYNWYDVDKITNAIIKY